MGPVPRAFDDRHHVNYRELIQDIARYRHGVITTWQAREAGVPAVEVRKIAARGYLKRLGQGAYRVLLVPASPLTPYAEALAVAGQGSHLGPTATLAVHGLIERRWVIDVCVPREPRRAQVPSVHVTRSFRDPREISDFMGLRVLCLPAALSDHLPRVGEERLGVVLDAALLSGRIDREDWEGVRRSRHGRGWNDC